MNPQNVIPQEILFSLPTLNDALPNDFSEDAPSPSTIMIHEDDWRQFEFVSSSFTPVIDQELADIDAIWRTESVRGQYTAFKKLHIRSRIPNPFSHALPADAFKQLIVGETSTFTFRDAPKILNHVVAIRTGGLIFYATLHENSLFVVGISLEAKPSLDHETALRITSFMKDHELLLIHWPSVKIFDSPISVENFLEGKTAK